MGSSKYVDIDVCIILVIYKDLYKEMEESMFREDLYYCLNVVNLKFLFLKFCSEDILLLVCFLL